jgi:hypothetical protein
MKQYKKLALFSLAASASLFACKAKTNSELSSYEFRNGDQWIVIGMKPGDINVSFRECTRDEVLKIGNRNLTLDSCSRPKTGDAYNFEDIPFAAFRLIFSEQFKIDAGEMKRWQEDRKLAKFYYDGYQTSIKSAKTDQERQDAERDAEAQKAIIDNADRYIESHNVRESYVEKVMKYVLPSQVEGDSASLETHKLITSGEVGINDSVRLIDELMYPFQKWSKSVLNPETQRRIDELRKKNKNDYTSEFLDDIAAAESTIVYLGAWLPRGMGGELVGKWEKTDWLTANSYCNSSKYSMPSKRELAAWYVFKKVNASPAWSFPPEANNDEGYIWVRDDIKFDTNQIQELKPRSGYGNYFPIQVNNLTDSIVGKIAVSDNGVLGTAVAFSPTTGKYFSQEMFYNSGAPSQKAWLLCSPHDAKIPAVTRDQLAGVTMCALKFQRVEANYIRSFAKMKYGKDRSQITWSLKSECDELIKEKVAYGTSCEVECEPFETWVNPPKQGSKP